MLKYFCCGISKKNNLESENEQFQLLLLGPDQSAKFNILEQIANLHNQFTEQQRINRIPLIKDHIRDSITDLLHSHRHISVHSSLEHPENEWRVTNVLTMTEQIDFNYPMRFFEHVSRLWIDPTIRSYLTHSIQNEMINSVKHFLDRIDQIKQMDYIPTDQDMIYSRQLMSQICEMSFTTLDLHFRLIEIDLLQPSRRKWIHCFSDINAIIFIANCSHLDGIIQSLNQFNGLVNKYNYHLNDKPVILLLNNLNCLSDKINLNNQEEELTVFMEFLSIFEKSIHLQSYTFTQLKLIIRNTFIMKFNECSRSYHPLYVYEISDGNVNIVDIVSNVWPKIIRQDHAFGYQT